MAADMSEQLALIEVPADIAVFRAEHAEAIRLLGKRVTTDIIEIGARLIAVKKTCQHGEWLPWLDEEFGWSSTSTAERFIRVAENFGKFVSVTNLEIDAGALYALAAPTVPKQARIAAVDEAKDGKHITKKRADELIEEARAKAFNDAVAEYQANLEVQVTEAVQQATALLKEDRDALKLKIDQIHADAANLPGIEASICHMLGQSKLTADQCQNLAQILNTTISFGGRSFPPISKEKQKQVEEHLQIASAVTRAFETLASAPTVIFRYLLAANTAARVPWTALNKPRDPARATFQRSRSRSASLTKAPMASQSFAGVDKKSQSLMLGCRHPR